MGKTGKKIAAGNVRVVAAADEVKRNDFAMLLKLFPGNRSGSQTVRLCHALKKAPVTSYDAHAYLDIYDVSARVSELRAHGYLIETVRVAQSIPDGGSHRVVLYILLEP